MIIINNFWRAQWSKKNLEISQESRVQGLWARPSLYPWRTSLFVRVLQESNKIPGYFCVIYLSKRPCPPETYKHWRRRAFKIISWVSPICTSPTKERCMAVCNMPPKRRKLAQSEEMQDDQGLIRQSKLKRTLFSHLQGALYKNFNQKDQNRKHLASS